MSPRFVTLGVGAAARERVAPRVRRAPTLLSGRPPTRRGAPVHPPEHRRVAGRFEPRGAATAGMRLGPGARARGAVAAFTGDRALAHAAGRGRGAPPAPEDPQA